MSRFSNGVATGVGLACASIATLPVTLLATRAVGASRATGSLSHASPLVALPIACWALAALVAFAFAGMVSVRRGGSYAGVVATASVSALGLLALTPLIMLWSAPTARAVGLSALLPVAGAFPAAMLAGAAFEQLRSMRRASDSAASSVGALAGTLTALTLILGIVAAGVWYLQPARAYERQAAAITAEYAELDALEQSTIERYPAEDSPERAAVFEDTHRRWVDLRRRTQRVVAPSADFESWRMLANAVEMRAYGTQSLMFPEAADWQRYKGHIAAASWNMQQYRELRSGQVVTANPRRP